MIKNVVSLAVLASVVFASASYAQIVQPKNAHQFELEKQECKSLAEDFTSTEKQKIELELCYIQRGIVTKPN